jgi:hypothetical protein
MDGAAQESNLPSLGLPDLTGFEVLPQCVCRLKSPANQRSKVTLECLRSAETGTKSGTKLRLPPLRDVAASELGTDG